MKAQGRRHVLVLLHRYVGLAIAAFIAIAGLTGSVLAYWQPLHDWLVPDAFASHARGMPLDIGELTRRVEASDRGLRITQCPLATEAGHTARVRVAGAVDPSTGARLTLRYDTVHVDPVSGLVLGATRGTDGEAPAALVLDFLYSLHYSLALPGDWGVWIMGIAAVLWFFDCFVGAWLTLPRSSPFLTKWRPAWGVKPRRLNFDLHRAGGLWFFGMLAILALSSVQQNLNDQVFMPIARALVALTPDPVANRPRPGEARRAMPDVAPQDIVRHARDEALSRGWQDRMDFMRRDDAGGWYRVVFKVPTSEVTTATRRELYFDSKSGGLIAAFYPGRGTAGDTAVDWLSALHYGTVLGWPYKLLLCATGIAIAMLSTTGVVIWWRKRTGRRALARRKELLLKSST